MYLKDISSSEFMKNNNIVCYKKELSLKGKSNALTLQNIKNILQCYDV